MKWLTDRPLLTHALLGAVDTVVLTGALWLANFPWPSVLAAFTVIVFYYGREAGQREHDLKNWEAWSPVQAWLGASFMYGWASANVIEWLAAAAPAVATGAALWWFL